eukprot:TRINITY_DN2843_c0_g1_i2.p1 TRINITY_DN2843_c0_g1~~TRINITY_DN2843_c0_g1_i2.p1  ORF type:complete len:416 (-),score=56.55 TRINITY_DN2843_c0_g1_i2:6-1154(-)
MESPEVFLPDEVDKISNPQYLDLKDIKTTEQAREEWYKRQKIVSAADDIADELGGYVSNYKDRLKEMQAQSDRHEMKELLEGDVDVWSLQRLSRGEIRKVHELIFDICMFLGSLRKQADLARRTVDALRKAAGLTDFLNARRKEENELGMVGSGHHLPMNKTEMANAVPWFGDAWRDANVPKMEVKFDLANNTYNELSEALLKAKQAEKAVKVFVDDGFDEKNFAMKAIYVGQHSTAMFASFKAVNDAWLAAKEMSRTKAEAYITATKKLTASFAAAAKKFHPGIIRDTRLCASRSLRVFRRSKQIDSTTMKCYDLFSSRKVCHCKDHTAGWLQRMGFGNQNKQEWCYSTQYFRPVPTSIARCFLRASPTTTATTTTTSTIA